MNGTVLSSKTNTLFLIQGKAGSGDLWQTVDQETTIEAARTKRQKLEKQYGAGTEDLYPLSFRLVLKSETVTMTEII